MENVCSKSSLPYSSSVLCCSFSAWLHCKWVYNVVLWLTCIWRLYVLLQTCYFQRSWALRTLLITRGLRHLEWLIWTSNKLKSAHNDRSLKLGVCRSRVTLVNSQNVVLLIIAGVGTLSNVLIIPFKWSDPERAHTSPHASHLRDFPLPNVTLVRS